ncbi:MAG: hypothetical protein ACK2T0_09395, partial [Anaerolineales bacterium]
HVDWRVVALMCAGSLPAAFRWSAIATLTMLLCGLSLSFLWHSGYSSDKIIGGLLPFRDAFDYYNGANWILRGEAIKVLNEGAAWRPLYPGFLAALLWLTGSNLQWALAIQVGLAGLCLALAVFSVGRKWGAAPAGLFAALLFFYIQPLLGTAYTETLGLAFGCLAFILLLESDSGHGIRGLIAGLVVLMLAVSVRAGAFFIFPALILWAGWSWRKAGRFSFRVAAIALLTVVAGYVVLNSLFARLTVEPGGFPFGNFAFTLYGQVNGGAGYHKAFEDLGVRDPAVIMRAAERFFIAHPASFALGAAKAYRDFFSPLWGVFSLGFGALDIGLSVVLTLLLLLALVQAVRDLRRPFHALSLAAFLGVLASVPFLPPIDGGIRIYASTMPFIYLLPALALAALIRSSNSEPALSFAAAASTALAAVLGIVTVLVPLGIRYLATSSTVAAPSCPPDQAPYVAAVNPGSYVDLIPAGARCGTLPDVCLAEFNSYGGANDPSDAAFIEAISSHAAGASLRLFDANNLLDGRPHVFAAPHSLPGLTSAGQISGCATETQVKGRPSIYLLQSVTVNGAATQP